MLHAIIPVFVTVQDHERALPNMLQLILQPFDMHSWVLFVAVMVTLSLIFSAKLAWTQEGNFPYTQILLNFPYAIIAFSSSILEQSVTTIEIFLGKLKQKSFSFVPPWILWSMMALTASNAYKGVLTTILTVQNLPSGSSNLFQLLECGVKPAVTLNSWGGNSRISSIILDHIENALNEKEVKSIPSVMTLLEQLKELLVWVKGECFEFIKNITKHKLLYYETPGQNQVRISRFFAFVDGKEIIEILRTLLGFFLTCGYLECTQFTASLILN